MKKITMFVILFILVACATNEDISDQNNGYSPQEDGQALVKLESNHHFEMPNVAVTEVEIPDIIRDPHALSIEEATEIGAYYIWELLGIDIADTHMELIYTQWDGHLRPYWVGRVASSELELNQSQSFIAFNIDALTGSRVDITYYGHGSGGSDVREINDISIEEIDVEPYLELAESYVKRHFNNSTVENLELDTDSLFTLQAGLISFIAVDQTSRVAEVMLTLEDKQLFSITTQHNDMDSEATFNSGGIG